MINGRAVPRKPLSFKSKQVLMRTHGRRATTLAPAHCIVLCSRQTILVCTIINHAIPFGSPQFG